jgi:hypothetical protein
MLRRELQDSGLEPLGVVDHSALMQRDARFYRFRDGLMLGFGNRSGARTLCG